MHCMPPPPAPHTHGSAPDSAPAAARRPAAFPKAGAVPRAVARGVPGAPGPGDRPRGAARGCGGHGDVRGGHPPPPRATPAEFTYGRTSARDTQPEPTDWRPRCRRRVLGTAPTRSCARGQARSDFHVGDGGRGDGGGLGKGPLISRYDISRRRRRRLFFFRFEECSSFLAPKLQKVNDDFSEAPRRADYKNAVLSYFDSGARVTSGAPGVGPGWSLGAREWNLLGGGGGKAEGLC